MLVVAVCWTGSVGTEIGLGRFLAAQLRRWQLGRRPQVVQRGARGLEQHIVEGCLGFDGGGDVCLGFERVVRWL